MRERPAASDASRPIHDRPTAVFLASAAALQRMKDLTATHRTGDSRRRQQVPVEEPLRGIGRDVAEFGTTDKAPPQSAAAISSVNGRGTLTGTPTSSRIRLRALPESQSSSLNRPRPARSRNRSGHLEARTSAGPEAPCPSVQSAADKGGGMK
jgi:hypothetical protein